MLISDLCDYSNAFIVVKGDIAVTEPNNTKRNKSVALKNNAPFINFISRINGVQIDNAEDLDFVMPMYNLLEYSKNYKKTKGSFWNYCRDEQSNPLSSNSESFKCKTSITGNTYNLGVCETGYDANKVGKNETKIVVPLKHWSNFWRTLNIPLINCKIELILTWSKNCTLADMTVGAAGNNNRKWQETFRTIKIRIYHKWLFKVAITNINYLIDPTFTKVKRLFVLSFERNAEGDHRGSFSHYYVPYVEIKDFNVLIDGKSFFDLPIKNE